jgi:tetratricopeptide (TPR) repeat protein
MEITHEQHLHNLYMESSSMSTSLASNKSPASPHRGNNVAKRLTGLMKRHKRTPPRSNNSGNNNSNTTDYYSSNASVASRNSRSVASDNLSTTISVEGMMSVGNYTIASHDTVKVSNKTGKVEEDETNKMKKRWDKLKRMMTKGVKKDGTVPSTDRPRTQSDEFQRKRTEQTRWRAQSEDTVPVRARSAPTTRTEQRMLDQSIRGRLDGLDVLSLGSARYRSLPLPEASRKEGDDFPDFSFAGQPHVHSHKKMVRDMLWSSSGRSPPEMILEGFLPGGDDRWSVRIEPIKTTPDVPPPAAATSSSFSLCAEAPPGLEPADTDDYEISDDGSPVMPPHKLWNTLWGSDPPPANMTDLAKVGVDENEDPLLNLAAERSIPIDIDEDTFIVTHREHVIAIQDIAALPLAAGRFSSALSIFAKLLKGLQLMEEKELKFLIGSTHHNMGIVYMWDGQFENALKSFTEAVEARKRYLPPNHPDTVVSLVRKGMACFALSMFDAALEALEATMPMIPSDSLIRSKVLNSRGVVYYKKGDFSAALRDLTSSLEIQRQWLDSPVRRESIVYDAAITLSNMGKLYLERSDHDLAYYVFEEALLLQTTLFRKDKDIVLESMSNLAIAKAKGGQTKKALQILGACLRTQNKRFGTESTQSIETLGMMAFIYAQQDSNEDALKCYSSVKRWQKTHIPNDHPSSVKTKERIRVLEEKIGKSSLSMWI